MKELTKREAMEILLAGGKVDYYFEDGTKGIHGPLRWDDELGIVDTGGFVSFLDYPKLTEYRVPIKFEYWLNVYPNSISCYTSRGKADRYADPTRIACVGVSGTEGDGLE